jgi:hypothetical protein
MPGDADPSKVCRDCGVRKPFSEFWAWKTSSDGRAMYCKPCFSVRNAASADRRAAREGRTRRVRVTPPLDIPAGHQFCPSCLAVLPLDDFVRNRSTKSGYGSYCRPCQNAKATASRNRLHGSTRHYHLRRRYGIGGAEVAAMLAQQGGCCPVCLRALTVKDCHVDHDHVTGKVRGILCFNCNGGLGQFRDNARLLRRAARYLRGHNMPLAHGGGSWGYVVLNDPKPSRLEEAFRGRLAELGVGPPS